MTTQTLTKPDTRCILQDTCQFFQQVSGTGEGKGDRERTRRTKDGCATIEWNAQTHFRFRYEQTNYWIKSRKSEHGLGVNVTTE